MASSSSEPGMKSEGSGGGGETLEAVATADQLQLYRGLKKAKKERGCTAKERISKMPPCAAGKRSSIYRGVTRHRWTGRYEAHLWDKSTWNQNQNKKGKQVYLGAYDDEEAAARAYDLAALKYWGPGTLINFPVTDYSRDLEEMQSLSREEYLASLRRKSSGFSRGISKYRGLSSRWDSSFGRMGGPEYFNSMQYGAGAGAGAGAGEDPAIDSNFGVSFSLDRKIDLTSYIKWWGPNRSRRVDSAAKSYQDTKFSSSEDAAAAAAGELRPSECAAEYTEPYQMPRLGIMSRERKKHKGGSMISALTILSQSASFKSLQEKAAKKQEPEKENDNKNTITRTTDYGKEAVEKPTSHDDGGGSERQLGISGGLSVHRNSYPLASFLNAPLLTSYNTIEPLVDPVLWSSLLPGLPPPGLPRAATEVPKTETTTSTYTYIRPQE